MHYLFAIIVFAVAVSLLALGRGSGRVPMIHRWHRWKWGPRDAETGATVRSASLCREKPVHGDES